MNYHNWNQTSEPVQTEKRKSGSTFGIILIAIGLYWILKETGCLAYLPSWDYFRDIANDLYSTFKINVGDLMLPLLLVLTGALLISGRRKIGGLLFLIALLWFIPGIVIPGVIVVLFFPVILIVVGVLLIKSLL